MRLPLKKTKPTVVIANNTICAFLWKWEFLKTFTCHSELYSFLILKDSSGEVGSNVNESDFYIALWNVSTLTRSAELSEPIVPNWLISSICISIQ